MLSGPWQLLRRSERRKAFESRADQTKILKKNGPKRCEKMGKRWKNGLELSRRGGYLGSSVS